MYGYNHPADRNAVSDDVRRHRAREAINEEYAKAIEVAGLVEEIASLADLLAFASKPPPIPSNEADSLRRVTWATVAGDLRDLIISNDLGCSESDFDELAEQRVLEEGLL